MNGGLFANEDIEIPQFTDEIRNLLLEKASADFDLSGIAKEKIAEREIERLKEDYDIEDRELFDKIKKGAVTQSNAREIKHLIKDTFSLVALKKYAVKQKYNSLSKAKSALLYGQFHLPVSCDLRCCSRF